MISIIRHGGLVLAAGNSLYAFAQWYLAVGTARIYGIVGLGVFSLALAITAPLQSFCNLALRYLFAIETTAKNDVATYLRVRLVAYIIFCVALIPIAFYTPTEKGGSWSGLIFAVGLLRFSEAGADICAGILIRRGSFESVATSSFARGFMMILGFTATNLIVENLVLAVAIGALGSLIVVALHDIPRATRAYGLLTWSWVAGIFQDYKLVSLVRCALPLAAAHSIVLLQPAIPRYLTEILGGTESLGALSALLMFLAIGNLPVIAINQAVLPTLASSLSDRRWHDFNATFFGTFVYCVIIGFVGILVAILAGDWLVVVIFGEEFAPYAYLLPIVMVVATVTYMSAAVGNATTATGQYRRLAPAYGFASLLTVIAGIVLISTHGLLGAIISFGLGSLTNGVAATILLVFWRRVNE